MDKVEFTLDRSKPPVPGKPKDVHFPEYFDVITQDGINILVIENHKIPSISVRMVFKNAGSFFDNDKPGLSQFTSELLSKGTTNRTATSIAEEIDFIGAHLSSGSDWDGSFVSLSILKKHLEKGIDILSDVIQNPVFSEDEINRLREQKISSIIQSKDDPSLLSDRMFNKVVFSKTPYEHQTEGSEDSLLSITRNDILNFYNKNFRPNNLIMAFVGDITPEEALQMATSKFIHWKLYSDNSPFKNYEFSLIPRDNKIYLVDKPESVQSNLKIGHLGIERNNPDFLGVSVLNMVLGGYFRSRINMNLRERNGFTYGAHSGFHSRINSGEFSVETDVRNEVTSQAIKEILSEVKKITEEYITTEELIAVKNYMTGIFPLQLETANSVATRAINLKLYGLSKSYYDNYVTNINMFTDEDLKNLAVKYIKPDEMQIIVTGNAKNIKDSLSELGEIKIYDQELNLKTH